MYLQKQSYDRLIPPFRINPHSSLLPVYNGNYAQI